MIVITASFAPLRAERNSHAATYEITHGGHLVFLDLCGWKRPKREDYLIFLLLASKKWRLQSACNHSTAYVDQWKG